MAIPDFPKDAQPRRGRKYIWHLTGRQHPKQGESVFGHRLGVFDALGLHKEQLLGGQSTVLDPAPVPIEPLLIGDRPEPVWGSGCRLVQHRLRGEGRDFRLERQRERRGGSPQKSREMFRVSGTLSANCETAEVAHKLFREVRSGDWLGARATVLAVDRRMFDTGTAGSHDSYLARLPTAQECRACGSLLYPARRTGLG